MKSLSLLFALFCSSVALAEIQTELDSFGGNEALYIKAKALNPEVENEVVQNRFSSRTHRFEVSPEVSGVFGGDAYNRTTNAGLNVNYHINPSWSIGIKYNYSFNNLTPEGESMVKNASKAAEDNPKNPNYLFPQVIYPKAETLGLVSWYPIVGKVSFGKWGVAHFDTYFLAGFGTIDLSNKSTSEITAGAGLGFWINQNLTTRMEYRLQQYTAEYYDKTQDMLTGVASVQMGWML